MYKIEWWGPSPLLEKWSKSSVPVYFDVMNSASEVGDEDGKNMAFDTWNDDSR